jgi:hypothetical protein
MRVPQLSSICWKMADLALRPKSMTRTQSLDPVMSELHRMLSIWVIGHNLTWLHIPVVDPLLMQVAQGLKDVLHHTGSLQICELSALSSAAFDKI